MVSRFHVRFGLVPVLLAIGLLVPGVGPATADVVCGHGTGSSRFEIACATYRAGGLPNLLGHAGLYYRYDPKTGKHQVI